MTIEDCKELGGKALKVVFASGDSFGDRQARIKNWKPFISLQFEVFNPAQDKVSADAHGPAPADDELPDPRRPSARAQAGQERGQDRHRRADERQRLRAGSR